MATIEVKFFKIKNTPVDLTNPSSIDETNLLECFSLKYFAFNSNDLNFMNSKIWTQKNFQISLKKHSKNSCNISRKFPKQPF
jgi:hypothetical protein